MGLSLGGREAVSGGGVGVMVLMCHAGVLAALFDDWVGLGGDNS